MQKNTIVAAAKTSSASFVEQRACSSQYQPFLVSCNFSGTNFVVKILVIIVIIVLIIHISLDVCQIEPAESSQKWTPGYNLHHFSHSLKHNC